MKNIKQLALAREMLAFLESSPLTPDLEWTKDIDFLYHFEAERQLIVRDLLGRAGIRPDQSFRMLDFGFLHGLTQEFTHREFPGAQMTVCDLPSSPIFKNKAYLDAVAKRPYMRLIPRSLDDIGDFSEQFDVIMLGEVIEHRDPTKTARDMSALKELASPNCVLIVTTPNAAGLYNCWMTLRQKDIVQVAPIPDQTMGYGHIHLWSLNLLKETALHGGWQFKEARFYHGREGEKFEEIKESWVGLGAQINVRLLKFLGNKYPHLRGFFVAAFAAKD